MSSLTYRPRCPPAGAPAWLVTFADLMTLLMCFFVLLLSFSEIEVEKFKQVAGSFSAAFGIQREVPAEGVPQELLLLFSPGKPEPTAIEAVDQTHRVEHPYVDLSQAEISAAKRLLEEAKAKLLAQEIARRTAQETATELQRRLKPEIDRQLLDIETVHNQVVIRIKENGSFPSGSATLMPAFLPTMARITEEVANLKGKITVNGHTDDIPISTERFRSNWELSSARAVSVLEFMLASGQIAPDQMEVKGHADNQPLLPNENTENRAKNRRVELIISPND